jgi:hypothetical protein
MLVAADGNLDIPHSNDAAAWNTFVAKINKSLDKLDLEFRHLNDEITGKEMYAIVSRVFYLGMCHLCLCSATPVS